MTDSTSSFRRAAAGLIPAAALLAAPALAQDAAPVAPPPVRATVPQASPTPSTPPAPQASPSAGTGIAVEGTATTPGSRTTLSPEAQAALDEADARRATRPRTVTPAPTAARPTPQASAPAAPRDVAPAAPAPRSDPAPVAAAPPAAAPTTSPTAEAAPPTAPTTVTNTPAATTEEDGGSAWPLLALLALAAAGIGLLVWRRRRPVEEDVWYDEEPVASDPEPAAEPVAAMPPAAPDFDARPTIVAPATPAAPVADIAVTPLVPPQKFQVTAPVIKPRKPAARRAPVAAAAASAMSDMPEPVAAPSAIADDVAIGDAEAADVASLTEGAPPVVDRPWLEFAMRPVRAGTNTDEALVEIELTVANAGNVTAEDVRISTFMLPAASGGDADRPLVDPPADAAVSSTTIDPGEGTRVDATLALLKSEIGANGEGGTFSPIVVADARYRLPDGSEGRTSASFVVGIAGDDGTLAPFALDERQMHDEIEARLHGEPQRA